MAIIHDIVVQHLPSKQRITPKGWRIFCAPCCSHRGHSADIRMRGNLIISENGDIGYNCYNCGFKFRFDNKHLSSNFEQFLGWINVDRYQIQTIKMELLKKSIDGNEEVSTHSVISYQKWETVDLPEGSRPIESIVEDTVNLDKNFLDVVEYLNSRGEAIFNGYDYWWSPSTDNDLNKRIIIPFFHNNKIVGWTARYYGTPPSGTPKYWNSSIPVGFLFNNDVADIQDRKYLILTEGPFDAIAVQGVSALGSTLNEHQIHWLANQNKEIIILPDRQRKNQELIDTALLFGWNVSFPDWEDNIKDAADACKKYGQIYTISSAIASRTSDPISIGIKRKMLK